MSKLYIVATPIGNLEDITFRAIRILKEVDIILCEDTRVTRVLLDRYEIKKPTLSYHQYSKLQKIDQIINLFKEGKDLALVSDAGTPGISDPGQRLIDKMLEEMQGEVEVVPIPGVSAVISALSISGFDTDEFLFLGFPPHKKGRQTFFRNATEEAVKRTVVFYESTHRIIKAFEELDKNEEKEAGRKMQVVACRELTKKFETIYRGTVSEVLERLKNDIIKGEFVVVIRK